MVSASAGRRSKRSGRLARSATPRGRPGMTPQALATASGELGRMGGGQHHQRRPRAGARRRRRRPGDGGVRVDQLAGLVEGRARCGRCRASLTATPVKSSRMAAKAVGGMSMAPVSAKARKARPVSVPSCCDALEIEPLEVGGDLDVHGRALGGQDGAAARSGRSRRARARMSLALVATMIRSIGRPMRLGHVAGEGVAEIAGGHGEADLAARRAQGRGGGEVVDGLGGDAGEVDRVDRRRGRPPGAGPGPGRRP